MSWVSHLPPAWLATIEAWLYALVIFFAILGALCAFVGKQVGGYRYTLERQAAENELDKTRSELSRIKEELSSKSLAAVELAEEAKRKPITVEMTPAPRRLTASDKDAIVERLGRLHGARVRISAIPGDGEAMAYAHDLMSALESAGWQVDGVRQSIYSGNSIGVQVEIKDQNNPPLGAVALAETLAALEIHLDTASGGDIGPDIVDVIVGHRPQRCGPSN